MSILISSKLPYGISDFDSSVSFWIDDLPIIVGDYLDLKSLFSQTFYSNANLSERQIQFMNSNKHVVIRREWAFDEETREMYLHVYCNSSKVND